MFFELVAALAIGVYPACDLRVSLDGPSVGESIVLAIATGVSMTVQAPMAPAYIGLTEQVRAFEFEVVVATRPNPPSDGWGILAPGQRFLAIPWAVDTTCAPALWPESEVWVPAGGQAVFRVSVARISAGVRVIDVLGEVEGYPYGRYFSRAVNPRAPRDPSEWLSASDYYRILAAAPDRRSLTSSTEQLRHLEDVYRSGPMALLERFPGPELLASAREWALTAR